MTAVKYKCACGRKVSQRAHLKEGKAQAVVCTKCWAKKMYTLVDGKPKEYTEE